MRLEFSGVDVVLRDMERIAHLDTAPLMAILGRAVVAGISDRTDRGLDENDGPFKPIKNARSTPLQDSGTMMAAIGVLSSDKQSATVGFRSLPEAQKAIWQHYGTTGPYPIRPKTHGGALAFGTSMSFANAMKSGRNKSRRLTMANARSNAQGMAIVRGVMHPGLPARPFFGISPKLSEELGQIAERWYDEQAKGTP